MTMDSSSNMSIPKEFTSTENFYHQEPVKVNHPSMQFTERPLDKCYQDMAKEESPMKQTLLLVNKHFFYSNNMFVLALLNLKCIL